MEIEDLERMTKEELEKQLVVRNIFKQICKANLFIAIKIFIYFSLSLVFINSVIILIFAKGI